MSICQRKFPLIFFVVYDVNKFFFRVLVTITCTLIIQSEITLIDYAILTDFLVFIFFNIKFVFL